MWIGLYDGKFTVRTSNIENHIEIEPPTADEWNHIAITRKNGILYVFYNGELQAQTANNTSFVEGDFYIGTDGASHYIKNSYIDELRIANSYCEWSGNFSVPTTEYKKVNEIVYHFNQEPYAISKGNNIISSEETKFGNASMYANNDKYMMGCDKSAVYFPNDFTIDFWLKLSEESLDPNPSNYFEGMVVHPTTGGMWIGLYDGKFTVRTSNIENHIEIEPPTTNEWNHIAVTRKNGILYVFYNGELQAQTANNTTFVEGDFYIGTDGASHYIKNSYIDELRILNGYCAWSRKFTPPTEEYSY